MQGEKEYLNKVICKDGQFSKSGCGPFLIEDGNCEYVGECLGSPRWPKPYDNMEYCHVKMMSDAVIGAKSKESARACSYYSVSRDRHSRLNSLAVQLWLYRVRCTTVHKCVFGFFPLQRNLSCN